MSNRLRILVLDVLPTAANVGLIAYLTWQLNLMPFIERQGEFRIFSVLYAIGGLVIAVAGVAAFVHGASQHDRPRRRLLMLALVNLIIPTVLLLVLLKFR
jgi:hypothetical protein